ncbi:MAG: hypothetical protein KZQ57_06100, partial [gamma proteobacterium symbiont of Lucinoma myriamae]|nr:hypothetical protein [gamma proteobacterium symbiont of Lucinoma myriamae]
MKPIKKDLVTFGLIWAFIFILIAFYPLVDSGEIRHWSLFLSIVFFWVALLKPSLLSSFYTVWVRFGRIMGSFISKVVLFFLFYIIFTPVALFLKFFSKDLLHKRLDK